MIYKRICQKLIKVLEEDQKGETNNQQIMNKYRDLAQDALFQLAADEMVEALSPVLKKLEDGIQ